jgi:hypothetical protein
MMSYRSQRIKSDIFAFYHPRMKKPLKSAHLDGSNRRQQFAQFPNMVRHASGHRGYNLRGAVDPAEVVMGDVKGNRAFWGSVLIWKIHMSVKGSSDRPPV